MRSTQVASLAVCSVLVRLWALEPPAVRAQSASPVAAYAMDEGAGSTIADATGHAHHGTLTNGPVWTTGRFGGALQFDGVDDRVRIADAPSLDLATAATFEAWIYPTAAPSGWRTILQKEVEAYFLSASGAENRPVSGGRIGGGCCPQVVGPAALPANTWTHLAATYDGSQLRLYVNGALAASRAASGVYQVTAGPLWLGGNAVYGEHFRGKIDELRIYPRALTAAEIQADMGQPVGSGAPLPLPPPPDTTPPSGTVTIQSGAAATSVRAVTLSLAAVDTGGAVTQMRFSNTGTSYSAAEAFAATRAWTLSSGAGTKTVYAQFKDAAGNWSSAATDTIVLDTTAPTLSAVAAGAITAQAATITWTSSEPATSQVEFGVTTSYGQATSMDSALVAAHAVALDGLAPLTTYNYRVRSRDAAGNERVGANATFQTAVGAQTTNHFQNEVLLAGLNLPTTLEFLPDGRMLIAELGGTVWILRPGATVVDPVPFLQIANAAPAGGQQGIMDLVLDPDFAANRHYYVFYTAGTPNRDRVSRFTANDALTGTVAGSEVVLYQDPIDAHDEHHGGALNFGHDGKLYVTTGDHFTNVSQSLASPRGKILRLNRDGTVPPDNPFHDGAGPNLDAIWARGLRNPFRASYDPPTGRLYVADVGGNDPATAFEEVNVGEAGANYGWPECEGVCADPAFTPPLYAYPHQGRDASITGGVVYRGAQFPAEYHGSYFFADYAQNWIRRLTFDSEGSVAGVHDFVPLDGTLDGPYGDIVHLSEGPDGALYYVDLGYSDVTGDRGVSKIRRIRYAPANLPPVAVAAGAPLSGPQPLTVSFSSAGSSDPEGQPLAYGWTFGDGGTSSEASPSHTYISPGEYTVRLTVGDGLASTLAAPLFVAAGHAPAVTILQPAEGLTFRAGDLIAFAGAATDLEDGALPPSAFTWTMDFLHDGHVHPGAPMAGATGTYAVPSSGHDFSGPTRYRLTLTVRDSDGLAGRASVVLEPQKVTLALATEPPGLTLHLDGIANVAPFSRDALVGFQHTVEARDQPPYAFTGWSDGGAQQHTVVVPSSSASYTAAFAQTTPPPPPGLAAAWGFNEGAGTAANDASPGGNPGTLVNGPVWTTGRYGGALLFDGVDDRVQVADSASLDVSAAATFSAWVFPTAAPTGWRTILQKEVEAYLLSASGGDGRPAGGGRLGSACCALVGAPSALPINTWTHVALTYDGLQLRLYVNGALASSAGASGAFQVNALPLWIGGNAVYGEHFKGKLDDVRIYGRALSAAEIQQDMATGVP